MTYEKSLGVPQIDKDEHIQLNGVHAKRVLIAGYDGTDLQDILVNPDGSVVSSSPMSIPKHDSQVIDESDANNVTITYKLSGVTVATKLIAVSGTTTTITVS